MDQNKFEDLTKLMATDGPRRGFLGVIAGGALGVLFGFSAHEAEAGPRERRQRRARQRAIKKRQQNRCKKVNRICQPFEAGKCCSKRCCPSLGAKAQSVSVCAPKSASQCCPASLGGGYCDLEGYRKCCPPTLLSPDGTCCKSAGSSCCPANTVQGSDYCCPPDSYCCDSFSGCCAGSPPAATGLSANSAPTSATPEVAGRKAG